MNADRSGSTDRRGRVRHYLGRHKALAVIYGLVIVLLVVVGTWAAVLNHQLADIPRFHADLDRPDRPTRVEGDAMNILLVGVDDGHGSDLSSQLQSGDWVEGSFRSDTMMVWHLSADRKTSQVVSIPRDSWVTIPGRGEAKLNAAFSYGGPQLLVRTLENTLDLYIDHVAVIDFQGFEDVTRTLGGVEITMADGTKQRLEGADALAYVRTRKTLPNGDFDRIDRQQNFLRSVLRQMIQTSSLVNPLRTSGLVSDLGKLVVLDDRFTDGEIRSLWLTALRQGVGEVTWMTAPNNGTGTADGQSIVRLDVPAARALLAAISDDEFQSYLKSHKVDLLGPEESVD
jgi:LCP family protein required for cell wall assembly